jgi:gliding motility-associated lipoprotein GldH
MPKKVNILIFYPFLSLCLILFSCGETPLYMKTHKFKENEWPQNEKPVFKVSFPGDTITYDVLFTVRSTINYNYNNIWLYINTTGPECDENPTIVSILGRLPVEIKMAKSNGEWIGNKSGTYVDHKLKFRQRRFCKGEYSFEIEQAVTIGTLDELSDLTIEVKPTVW